MGERTIDYAIKRLTAVYSAPDSTDPAIFLEELKTALTGFADDAITDGVTDLIKNRRFRTFPAIGEIREAVLEHCAKQKTAQVNYSAVYRDTEDKAARALDLVRPKAEQGAREEWLVAYYEFAEERGRLPESDEERRLVRGRFRYTQSKLREMGEWLASDPPREASRRVFRQIARTAVDAVGAKRLKIAELCGVTMEQREAAE